MDAYKAANSIPVMPNIHSNQIKMFAFFFFWFKGVSCLSFGPSNFCDASCDVASSPLFASIFNFGRVRSGSSSAEIVQTCAHTEHLTC